MKKITNLPDKFNKILNELTEGNEHFKSDQIQSYDLPGPRKQLVKGQKPKATILTCSDSRVVPELIFNNGLGSLFVIRNAGNIVVKSSLASIEYAVAHLDCPIFIVLGHQSCGAIIATHDGAEGSESIEFLANALRPSIEKAKARSDKDIIPNAIIENIYAQMANAMESPIISSHVEQKKLAIIGAYYSFDNGHVNYLEDCYY